jgi:hypothetical protein|nr:MAG TPA: hypothetical protein [Caudoviricetes sp.]
MKEYLEMVVKEKHKAKLFELYKEGYDISVTLGPAYGLLIGAEEDTMKEVLDILEKEN